MRRSAHFFSVPRVDQLVLIFDTHSALEGSTVQVSEQGLRKILYQKVRCW
jgi:hypothetical protein